MQLLTLGMIVVATLVEFLSKGDFWGRWAILPKGTQFLPEVLSAIALVAILSLGTRNRFRHVRPEYWLFFGGIAVIVCCGILVNDVEPGPTFAGIRTYLWAMPWFFLPAVYAFAEEQIRTQLKLLLVICLIQLPLAVQQLRRTVSGFAGDVYTGDWISGTLMLSSTLSICLIGATCIAFGLLLRKRISGRQFVVLAGLLLLPTTINETKSTLVLLPLGLLIILFAGARAQTRIKYGLATALLFVGFLTAFVPIYDSLSSGRAVPKQLSEFWTDPQKLQRYMHKGTELGTTERIPGRIDSVIVASKFIGRDPVWTAFGLGIGNASASRLGEKFSGHYSKVLQPFLVTSFARLVLEIGAIGFALLMAVYWLIFSDARRVAQRHEGLVGAIAVGWTGVTVIMGVALFYKDLVPVTSLSFLFWYFSGLIAAERVRETT
jgi:hypothetical protein